MPRAMHGAGSQRQSQLRPSRKRPTPTPAIPLATSVLALGSAETDGFNPRQGTDLLSFLARVIESCMRRWQNDSH